LARFVISDVLDATQRKLLASEVGYRDFNDPIIAPVVEVIREKFDISPEDPSYVRVECRKEGHDWHLDNGPHMPWVEVSASVLLTEKPEDAVGGILQFHDIIPDQKPGELWAWDTQAENRHRVSSHDGWRVCLLMFLQAGHGTS
tara:strand:- start:1331 stop:1762 length:432 start_codon:yes stop_codon:yes gene_type:complete